jgi:serine/threonine protein kinase
MGASSHSSSNPSSDPSHRHASRHDSSGHDSSDRHASSYCLNPTCCQPQNPPQAQFCQTCGQTLQLQSRYRALRPLGQGGFGRTFLAIDEQRPSQPRCVIKQAIGSSDPTEQQERLRLFHAEAERLDQLGNHPQIPTLLATFAQDQHYFLVQEWIDGDTLGEERRQLDPWSAAHVQQMLSEVLEILTFVHSHQVIHRDIKPSNILRRQGDRRLVLIDFGAAKATAPTDWAKTGTIIGSPEYVAPEQMRGQAFPASDLYSLGMTAIALWSGRSPFDLYDPFNHVWHWREWVPDVQQDGGNLAEVLDRAIQSAIHDRYPSAAAMREAILTVATPARTRRDRTGQPHTGKPPTAPNRTSQNRTGQPRARDPVPARQQRPPAHSPPRRWSDLPTITSVQLRRGRPDRSPPPRQLAPDSPPTTAQQHKPTCPNFPAQQPNPAHSCRWLYARIPNTLSPMLIPTPIWEQLVQLVPTLERRLDGRSLERALAAGQWAIADEETARLLGRSAGEQRHVIPTDRLQAVRCEDLGAIDALWRVYSEQRFGWTVQAQILCSEAIDHDYGQFCHAVGWPLHRPSNGVDRLLLNAGSNPHAAPLGHLPSRRWVAGIQWWRHAEAMTIRLATCR